jgi:hypothetical protein
MEDSEKDKIKQKWAPILDSMGVTGSKSDWLAEYAQNMTMCELSHPGGSTDNFPSILPMAMRVASKSIGMDLVSVSPLPGPGMSSEKRRKIEAEVKQENRDGKIDSLVEGKEYVEKTIEDHPDYVPGPSMDLLYLDFKYDSSTQSSI